MGATGSATIDFGAEPGANETSVFVADTNVLSTSYAEAWIMADTTSDHTANDHTYAALLIAVVCAVPTAATGFTIYARSTQKLAGTFTVRWVWN